MASVRNFLQFSHLSPFGVILMVNASSLDMNHKVDQRKLFYTYLNFNLFQHREPNRRKWLQEKEKKDCVVPIPSYLLIKSNSGKKIKQFSQPRHKARKVILCLKNNFS